MVYNSSSSPADMPLIFQDFFAELLKNGILYAGLIVLVVLFIIALKAIRGK